ncbi:hypothetical protein [Microbulbifer sp. MCCC 1A16149]|uniref:hypothetical protein n=1 Tax=Microbulbifer sp. MCCC 1A16149 TaxID=3411322 RepID=UPI003D11A679
MADLQRIESLLKAALDAGETEDAKFFQQQMYAHPDFESRRKQQLEKVNSDLDPTAGTALGATRSALQGATFGFSDELAAGFKSAVAGAMGDDPAKAYYGTQQELDQEQRDFAEKNPGISLGLEIGGGLTSGGLGLAKTMAKLAGKGVLPKVAGAAGIGAAEGGLYGAGTSREGERIPGAVEGGAVGAVTGPLAAGAGKLISEGVGPVADWVGRNLINSPQKNAQRYLSETMAQEGVGGSELARALREMPGNAILSDVSTGARNTLEGILHQPDNPAIWNQAESLLRSRNAGQQPRLIGDLAENLGIDTMGIQQTVNALGQQRSKIAGPLYQQAYRQPLKRTEKLESLMRAPAVKQALGSAQTIAANQRIAGDQVSHMRLFDLAKQDLDDQIGRALTSGEKGKARDLIRLKQDLVSELDDQVPAYKQARDVFANHSAMIDAAEYGRRILREDADVIDDVLKGMGQSEKEMFRIGAGRAIRDKLMQASQSGDATKRLNSGLVRERMRRAFPSENSFNDFMKKVEMEADIYSTTAILQNSATARRLQQGQKLKGESELPDSTAGFVVNTFKKIFGANMSPEAREELARLTMQRVGDVDLNALAQAVNKSALTEAQKGNVARLIQQYAGATAPPAAVATYNQAFGEQQSPMMTRQQALANALRNGQ